MNNYALLLLGALVLLPILAFWTGYDTAADLANRRNRKLLDQVHTLQQQRRELTAWIRTNWTDPYAAYRKGVDDGYQQGVSQSSSLTDEPL